MRAETFCELMSLARKHLEIVFAIDPSLRDQVESYQVEMKKRYQKANEAKQAAAEREEKGWAKLRSTQRRRSTSSNRCDAGRRCTLSNPSDAARATSMASGTAGTRASNSGDTRSRYLPSLLLSRSSSSIRSDSDREGLNEGQNRLNEGQNLPAPVKV